MLTSIALSSGYIALMLFIIGKYPFFRPSPFTNRHFQLLFAVKLIAGIGLLLVYTKFYPDRKYADIFRYYDDSAVLFNTIYDKPWDYIRMLTGYHAGDTDLYTHYHSMKNWFNSEMVFNDARTMIRLNAFIRLFSLGSYYPHMLLFCFMAFAGLTGLFHFMQAAKTGQPVLTLIAVFLIPSVLFWTSGVIKEAFLVFAIGMMLYHFNKLISVPENKLRHFLYVILYIFCLMNIKSYVLFAILPSLISLYIVQRNSRFIAIKFVSVHLVYLFMLYHLSPLITGMPLPLLLKEKQDEFYQLANAENAKSTITIQPLDDTFSTLVKNAPSAFITTCFRPFPNEAHNAMMVINVFENLIIYLVFAIFIVCTLKGKSNLLLNPILLTCLFFSIIMFVLIGWVTPILGAVVRYKVPSLPFFVFLLIAVPCFQKVEMKLQQLIRIQQ